MIRPKQNDLDLLGRLIDLRDSAHLAGHTDDPFRLFDFNGTESVLYGPERNEGQDVSTMGMRRLQDLGLLHVIDVLPKGFTFDLVDDVRDRLEEMRVALGQPSRLGEIEAAKERAEAAQRDLETRVRESVASRAASRKAFARHVGRWVRRAATVALGVIYVGVVVVAGYFVSSILPLALVIGIVGVAVFLTVLDWLLHIDGFGLRRRG